MTRKQNELNQQEKKWFKEATKAWESQNFLEVVHKNKEKSIQAIILDPVLEIFFGIQE